MEFTAFWQNLLNSSPNSLSPVRRALRRLAQKSWNTEALRLATEAARLQMEAKAANAPTREFPRRRYRTRVARTRTVSACGYRW